MLFLTEFTQNYEKNNAGSTPICAIFCFYTFKQFGYEVWYN
jgi:hypothetical protein